MVRTRATVAELAALAPLTGGALLVRAATVPHDWMSPSPTAAELAGVVIGSLLIGLGLAIAARSIALRLGDRRSRARRGVRAPLPTASLVGGPPARRARLDDPEAAADEFLASAHRRRSRVGFAFRALGLSALTAAAAAMGQDCRQPTVSADVATLRARAIAMCACRDLACAERVQPVWRGLPFDGAIDVARPPEAQRRQLVDAVIRREECRARLPAPTPPYGPRPRACPLPSRPIFAPAASSPELAWRIPDGHGGVNVLCRGFDDCRPWLVAKGDGRLVIADVDGDGAPDVARGDPWPPGARGGSDHRGAVTVYRAANGGFRPMIPVVGLPSAHLGAGLVSVGDLDCDGRADLVALAVGGEDYDVNQQLPDLPQPARLVVFPGGAAPGVPIAQVTNPVPWSLAAGDVDGDGNLDVALLADGRLEIRRGGRGGIDDVPTWSFPTDALALALVDDDGDGDADVWLGDPNRKPARVTRWAGGRGGPEVAGASVRLDPALGQHSFFGAWILPGSFTGPRRSELAVIAHGDEVMYVFSVLAADPLELVRTRFVPVDAHVTAADLDADGVDELIVVEADRIGRHDLRTGGVAASRLRLPP